MRMAPGIWLAVALVGSVSAGGFDPGRRGGPDNSASVRSVDGLLDGQGLQSPEATFDDLATELAWLEGRVWEPHTNILSRRCDRRRHDPTRQLRRLNREFERLSAEFQARNQAWVEQALPLESPPPLPPQTSWLGSFDP